MTTETLSQVLREKWLTERQEMLVLFCQLAGVDPYGPDKPVRTLLRKFCQVLMDYMAFGHFEVCERIVRDEAQHPEVLQAAEGVFPRLAEATRAAVAFNDKYDAPGQEQLWDELHDDLSRLGEELATRIELEDSLLNVLDRQRRRKSVAH